MIRRRDPLHPLLQSSSLSFPSSLYPLPPHLIRLSYDNHQHSYTQPPSHSETHIPLCVYIWSFAPLFYSLSYPLSTFPSIIPEAFDIVKYPESHLLFGSLSSLSSLCFPGTLYVPDYIPTPISFFLLLYPFLISSATFFGSHFL